MAVTISENAAKEMKRVIAEQTGEEKLYLRIRVCGGGCSGFQHKLDISPEYNKDKDTLEEISGIDVVIDNRSKLYLNNVTIDYLNDLNKRGFVVTNHEAKSTCGCGSSFGL